MTQMFPALSVFSVKQEKFGDFLWAFFILYALESQSWYIPQKPSGRTKSKAYLEERPV